MRLTDKPDMALDSRKSPESMEAGHGGVDGDERGMELDLGTSFPGLVLS